MTYDQVLEYTEKLSCSIKTFDEMCSLAHYSPGVANGRALHPVQVRVLRLPAVGASVVHRRRRVAPEDGRRARRGPQGAPRRRRRAQHQQAALPPRALHAAAAPHHGMDRCGADNLHLIYLNLFKHLFKYTVHEGLPESKKIMVRDFCKNAGFYSYDTASVDEDPCKHWIGREVKRFIEKAEDMVPFLLQIAALPAECMPEMATAMNGDGEMESDGGGRRVLADMEEDIEREEELEPVMMKNAGRWDHFFVLVESISRPWPQGDIWTRMSTARGALSRSSTWARSVPMISSS